MTLIDKTEAVTLLHEIADDFADPHVRGAAIAVAHIFTERADALPPAKQEYVADSNARGVGVKPLEWVEDFADHPFGWYESIDCGDCIVLTQSGVSVGSFHDINAAKAAAQADYEARILAALEGRE